MLREAQRAKKVEETKAKQREKNEAALKEQEVIQVLEIDRGNRRVRVKRRNGVVGWVEFDDVGDALKSFVADFEGKDRASRAEARARARADV